MLASLSLSFPLVHDASRMREISEDVRLLLLLLLLRLPSSLAPFVVFHFLVRIAHHLIPHLNFAFFHNMYEANPLFTVFRSISSSSSRAHRKKKLDWIYVTAQSEKTHFIYATREKSRVMTNSGQHKRRKEKAGEKRMKKNTKNENH